MSAACDPQGKCPKCGYQNGLGAQRCVRCRTTLVYLPGCTGACTECLSKQKAAVPEPKK